MNAIRRITDIVLFFSFCFLLGSGIMMKYSFVKGMGPQSVMGLAKPEWCDLHFAVSILMVAALAVHLLLNKAWIEKIAAMNKKWLAAAAISIGIALAAALAVWPTTYGGPGSGNGNQMRLGHGSPQK